MNNTTIILYFNEWLFIGDLQNLKKGIFPEDNNNLKVSQNC